MAFQQSQLLRVDGMGLQGAVHGIFQFLRVNGLEQVVQRTELERPQGIAVIGRGEDDLERDIHQLLQHPEAVHHGHFHIQKNQIRGKLADDGKPFLSIGCSGNYLNARAMLLEEHVQVTYTVRFVVYDDGFHLKRLMRVDEG